MFYVLWSVGLSQRYLHRVLETTTHVHSVTRESFPTGPTPPAFPGEVGDVVFCSPVTFQDLDLVILLSGVTTVLTLLVS